MPIFNIMVQLCIPDVLAKSQRSLCMNLVTSFRMWTLHFKSSYNSSSSSHTISVYCHSKDNDKSRVDWQNKSQSVGKTEIYLSIYPLFLWEETRMIASLLLSAVFKINWMKILLFIISFLFYDSSKTERSVNGFVFPI